MYKDEAKCSHQDLTEIPFLTFNHSFDQKKINLIRFLQQVLSPSCATDDFMSKWKSFRYRLNLSIDN